MSIITYFENGSETVSGPRTRGVLGRFFDRVVAAREARVAAELKASSHLLPHELDQVAWKVGERSEDSLPFIR